MKMHRFELSIIGQVFFALSLIIASPSLSLGAGGNRGGSGTTSDYGDLFVLYRDSNGVPYVTEEVDVNDPETGEMIAGGLCQQPLPTSECPDECITDGFPTGQDVVNLDPLTCSVPIECSVCTMEVEFGRDNVIRAKESVLSQQYRDAITTLSTAGCITLDPSGRPVASTLADEGIISSTIDSPLQNLAIYLHLMQKGYLGDDPENPINLRSDSHLLSAARALGASAAKDGKVTVDMIAYMNEILGLTEQGASVLPRTFVDVREEVKGVMTVVRKWFLDYSGYEYDRYANFSTTDQSLPSPAYIPDESSYGQFEYLSKVDDSYVPTVGSIFDVIFSQKNAGDERLTGFTQAADDARAVINFIHLWEVPEMDRTAIVCDTTNPGLYDVSINEASGLQVPVRMIAAGDGREGEVTIENSGPATAYDIKINVQGVLKDTNDEQIAIELLSELGGTPLFAGTPIVVSLNPGEVVSIPFFFSVDRAGIITWTAEAITDDLDINLSNNHVTEYTTVTVPKGNGGNN